MYRYKKILVALDFSSKDEALIRYAKRLSDLAKSETISFIHVAESFDLPEQILREYPSLAQSVDEYTRNKMKSMIENYFEEGSGPAYSLEVTEGEPISGILRMICDKDIDLVLVGKPDPGPGKHNIAEKLARKAPCSVLVVPEGSKSDYERILLATDFSDHAREALDVASAFAKAAGIKAIDAVHVYNLPLGYYKTGKSEQEFDAIMRRNAQIQHEQWIRGADLRDIALRFETIRGKRPDTKIIEQLRDKSSDLLVLSTRGRSTGAAVLLGSITEQLIRESQIPVLAVKQKGEGLDLLDIILNV